MMVLLSKALIKLFAPGTHMQDLQRSHLVRVRKFQVIKILYFGMKDQPYFRRGMQ